MSEGEPKRYTFHEHGLLLYLDRELYAAIIKLQADKNLGRSYSGLLALETGLHELGYISQGVHESHFKRYSQPLEPSKPMTLKEQREKDELEMFDKVFKGMLEQWKEHSGDPAWLLKASRSAEKYRDRLESARQLLGRIDAENNGTVGTVGKPEARLSHE
jgi:hypothetical protein